MLSNTNLIAAKYEILIFYYKELTDSDYEIVSLCIFYLLRCLRISHIHYFIINYRFGPSISFTHDSCHHTKTAQSNCLVIN